MDELFILTLARRLRNNCRVDARVTFQSAGLRPANRPDTTPGASAICGTPAASAWASGTGRGAGGRAPAPSPGQRSHRFWEILLANLEEIPFGRRERDFFEATATPARGCGRPGDTRRQCAARLVEIRGFAPRLPSALRRIVRGLTPVNWRVKQPSHSRSFLSRIKMSAPDASAGFQAARRGLPVPTAHR
jgi:hypothetical protein